MAVMVDLVSLSLPTQSVNKYLKSYNMSIFVGTGKTVFIKHNAVGVGSTTTTGRNAGVNTEPGFVIYNVDTTQVEVYDGNQWIGGLTSPFEATGGTKDTTSRSGFAVHTFTGDGTLETEGLPQSSVEVLVIGGGGGAAHGGGGAGAMIYKTGLELTPGTYPISVGAGGPGNQNFMGIGVTSTALGFTAPGGGGGGYPNRPPDISGGSGGGSYQGTGGAADGATGGTAGTASPDSGWGNAGGDSAATRDCHAGGGGAGGAGGNITFPSPFPHGTGGDGGNGLAMSITGSPVTRAGGGGGGAYAYPPTTPLNRMGAGGPGGGGSARPGSSPDRNGTANTGSGGGAPYGAGGNGGSGVVIVAYPTS